MSSVDSLREFVNERLTAAAEEILGVFKQTIVKYEEEIDRQRRLLDNVWKSGTNFQGTELQQPHVCKEKKEDVLVDQQLCDLERNFSLDPEPPQVKQEQEELCTSQGGEQLVVKLESDTFMLTPTHEESEPVPKWDNQLLSDSHVAESQDQTEITHRDSVLTTNTEPETKERYHKGRSNTAVRPNRSEIHFCTHTEKKSFICDTCGKGFNFKSNLTEHLRIHTGEKPYLCKTCGKQFSVHSSLKTHMLVHTGEKQYSCHICGKDFRLGNGLKLHMRTHTGEKPYSCKTCGKDFSQSNTLLVHMRVHTGEKPYICKTCRKGFCDNSGLRRHIRTHTGEKPYLCKTCGKAFRDSTALSVHMRMHTGEKPYSCSTCGKDFRQCNGLKLHMRVHACE